MTIEERLRGLIVSRYPTVKDFAAEAGIKYTTLLAVLQRGVENSGAERAREALRSFSDAVEAMDVPRLKIIVRDLIDRVEYADGDLRIFWKIK